MENAFVYVLEGTVVMQVRGAKQVMLRPGRTFYERPTTCISSAGMRAIRATVDRVLTGRDELMGTEDYTACWIEITVDAPSDMDARQVVLLGTDFQYRLNGHSVTIRKRQDYLVRVTVQEAARAGNVVIVTIPEAKIRDLPKNLFEGAPSDIVVIDTGNYYPRERDGRIDEIEAGIPESRWVETQLGRPVFKSFQHYELQTPARIRPSCRHSRAPRAARRGRRPQGETSGATADRRAWI